jgi:hypothetical protein
MAQKRKRRTSNLNNGNKRRYSGARYGNGQNSGDQAAQRVSSVAAEAVRATPGRVAENTMAAADIMREQTEQFVDELCQQSDLMARSVENFLVAGSNWSRGRCK